LEASILIDLRLKASQNRCNIHNNSRVTRALTRTGQARLMKMQ
jgi:hypothetical protein